MTNSATAIRGPQTVAIPRGRNLNEPDSAVTPVARNLAEADRSREKRKLPLYLFRSWPEIRARMRSACQLALFLDFDGTLVGLQSRPGDVVLAARTRNVLRNLLRHSNVFIAIVSGRRIGRLQSMVALEGIEYFGLHGAEREGKTLTLRRDSIDAIGRACRSAHSRLEGLRGVWIEDKEVSFAVHYRKARPATVLAAHLILTATLAPHLHSIRLLDGERVWEILPREIPGKGPTVRELMDGLPKGTVAVYAGNDETDEPAFAAIPDQITVRVGPRCGTNAGFYLHNPAEVLRFLSRLEEELP